jgi:hypothetical protein
MKTMTLKHGATSIPVMFVTDEVITKAGKGLLEEGQFLFGMYSPKKPKIFINQECDDRFGTFVHELAEFVISRYGVKVTHEQLSIMSAMIAKVLEENWDRIGETFNLGISTHSHSQNLKSKGPKNVSQTDRKASVKPKVKRLRRKA